MEPLFIMLCGLPGSGKSTYASNLKTAEPLMDYQILSSDAIRAEICGDENSQDKNGEVFTILHQRVKDNLREGKHVIYDATNINSKRRKAFLDELKNIPCRKECYIIATPYELCLSMNQKRERNVPESVIKRMYMNWETPYYFEGWDNIKIIENTFFGHLYHMTSRWRKCIGFDQKNHHHELTLDHHMLRTRDYLRSEENIQLFELDDYYALLNAAIYHDCGKFFTQVFYNGKGEPTEEAHYFQHHCVGAYDCLCDPCQSLLTAVLINLHMQPYFWKHEKTKNKYKKLWGDKLFNMVMKLHEADVAAH